MSGLGSSKSVRQDDRFSEEALREVLQKPVPVGDSIPSYMHNAIIQYIQDGGPAGRFLAAVFSNDMKEAVARADDKNIYALPAYIHFLWNFAPVGCWGSEERYQEWSGTAKEPLRIKVLEFGRELDL